MAAIIISGAVRYTAGSVFSYFASRHFIKSTDPKMVAVAVMCSNLFTALICRALIQYLFPKSWGIYKISFQPDGTAKTELEKITRRDFRQQSLLFNVTNVITLLILRYLGQQWQPQVPSIPEALGLLMATRTVMTGSLFVMEQFGIETV